MTMQITKEHRPSVKTEPEFEKLRQAQETRNEIVRMWELRRHFNSLRMWLQRS